MSAPAPLRPQARKARRPQHIHLPSVHVRTKEGAGYDYEEDLYVTGGGQARRIERVVSMVVYDDNEPVPFPPTRDVLCPEDAAYLEESLPLLMQTDLLTGDSPDEVREHMQQRAQLEYERILRIAAGVEKACRACGCSATRSCSGGCVWATETHCSRCV